MKAVLYIVILEYSLYSKLSCCIRFIQQPSWNFSRLLFPMDIASLYTVTCSPWRRFPRPQTLFDQRTVKEPSSETLLRLAEQVLTLNCFLFGGSYNKQTSDVAMGTKMGTSYVNLFVGLSNANFQSIQRPQTWTLRSPHWRLHRRYLLYHRGAHSIFNRRQFFLTGPEIYLGN